MMHEDKSIDSKAWKIMEGKFSEKTVKTGDHTKWTSKHIDIMCNGKKLPAYSWFHALQLKMFINMKGRKWEKLCDEKNCISHYVPRQITISSVPEMDEYDYLYVIHKIERDSMEIDGIPNPNIPTLTSKCRIWQKEKTDGGYGHISIFNKKKMAAQVVWEMSTGEELKPGLVIRHKCLDHPDCITENHLEEGTRKQNGEDRIRDGTSLKGEKNPRTTLTNEIAREIFFSKGDGRTGEERAKDYGTTVYVVRNIDSQRGFMHLFTEEEKEEHRKGIVRKRSRFTDEQVREIRRLHVDGNSIADIAEEMKAGEGSIRDVVSYKRFKSIADTEEEQKAVDEEEKKRYIESVKRRLEDESEKLVDEKGKTHWLRTSAKTEFGYTLASFEGVRYLAHQVSYMVFHNNGKDSGDKLVRHKCMYKNCVHPDCLEDGTHADNAADKWRDGTMCRGETHGLSTITEETAKKIKASRGEGSIIERAERFGVTKSIVAHIDCGNSWTHI